MLDSDTFQRKRTICYRAFHGQRLPSLNTKETAVIALVVQGQHDLVGSKHGDLCLYARRHVGVDQGDDRLHAKLCVLTDNHEKVDLLAVVK